MPLRRVHCLNAVQCRVSRAVAGLALPGLSRELLVGASSKQEQDSAGQYLPRGHAIEDEQHVAQQVSRGEKKSEQGERARRGNKQEEKTKREHRTEDGNGRLAGWVLVESTRARAECYECDERDLFV